MSIKVWRKMFFEVSKWKSPFELCCKAPVLCSLSGGMCVGWNSELRLCMRIHPSWYPISGTFSALCIQSLRNHGPYFTLLSSDFLFLFSLLLNSLFCLFFCSFPFMFCFPSMPPVQELVEVVLSLPCLLTLLRITAPGFLFWPKG